MKAKKKFTYIQVKSKSTVGHFRNDVGLGHFYNITCKFPIKTDSLNISVTSLVVAVHSGQYRKKRLSYDYLYRVTVQGLWRGEWNLKNHLSVRRHMYHYTNRRFHSENLLNFKQQTHLNRVKKMKTQCSSCSFTQPWVILAPAHVSVRVLSHTSCIPDRRSQQGEGRKAWFTRLSATLPCWQWKGGYSLKWLVRWIASNHGSITAGRQQCLGLCLHSLFDSYCNSCTEGLSLLFCCSTPPSSHFCYTSFFSSRESCHCELSERFI